MAFNGSGLFNIDSTGQPVSANTLIESADFNALTADLATGLSNCITKDGQQTITANLPMAGFRHTGVGNAVARTDYAAAGQVQDGKLNWVDGGGTADAITATYSPVITALVDGQLCCVRATAANATTTPTFAPNGLTARTIVKKGGAALVAGDIVADGHELILRYDLANTRWELLNPGAYAGTGANTFTGLQTFAAGADIASATTVDLTAATGNLVRITGTTATTGVTINNGQYVICYAAGAWPLTYHATNNPVPGGADYTCAAGDLVIYSKNNSGEISVQIVPKDGGAVVGKVRGALTLTGTISPTQITADQNDYNPTGLSTSSTLRLTSDASRNVTGLQGGADGRVLVLHNVGSNNIVLKDESASSTAGNRFALGADITLGADQAAVLQYDSTSSRWRCFALPAASSSSGLVGVTTFSSNGTWTKPGGCNKIVAMAVGGGGAGGGATTSTISCGSGGCAGAVNWAYTASPAASYSVTIGAGGSGVSAGTGNSGSATTVGALLTAAGGVGGVVQSFSSGTGDSNWASYGLAGQSCLGAGGAVKSAGGAGNAASANTGAGGGGAFDSTSRAGGAGGSGYVIIWEFA